MYAYPHLEVEAEYLDDCYSEIFVEPSSRPGYDWDAFETADGDDLIDPYPHEVLELLVTDADFTVTICHRRTGEPWTPDSGARALGAA